MPFTLMSTDQKQQRTNFVPVGMLRAEDLLYPGQNVEVQILQKFAI